MLMPSIIDDNLFDDWFDDDFYMPYVPDMSRVDKKLYGNKAAREMKTDVKETDQGYEVAVDLPGVKKDDVTVELIRRERYSGTMSRSFYVGKDMKQEDVHAAFNDGILTLQLPKKDAAKQIEDQKHQIKIA